MIGQNHRDMTFIKCASRIYLLDSFNAHVVVVSLALDRKGNSVPVSKNIYAEIAACLRVLCQLKTVGGKNVAGQSFKIRTGDIVQIGQ